MIFRSALVSALTALLVAGALVSAQPYNILPVTCGAGQYTTWSGTAWGCSTPTPTLPSGTITLVTTGTCAAGSTEVAALNGVMLRGTLAASGNVGTSGGSDTYTPTGTVAASVFTGSPATSSAVSAGTPVGTNSVAAFTGSSAMSSAVSAGTPAGTNSAPSVSGTTASESAHTHSVTSNVAVADHASHTHTYTDVVNHVHVQSVNSGTTGASSGYTPDTSTSTSTSSGYSTANPTGGVATGTTAGPGATLTHTVTNNAVTSGAGSAHSHAVGTLAVSTSTFAGSALGTHAHTLTATGTNDAATFTGTPLGTHTHTLTATGTNNAPAFTGAQATVIPAYVHVIFCQRT